MSALAPDITVLLISRFILGYAVGGAFGHRAHLYF